MFKKDIGQWSALHYPPKSLLMFKPVLLRFFLAYLHSQFWAGCGSKVSHLIKILVE